MQSETSTLSFYRYHRLDDPAAFAVSLRTAWESLGVLGRTYVAGEGINAQVSIPSSNLSEFRDHLDTIEWLRGVRLNYAIESASRPFRKLKIKVREKIVADGISDPSFDPSDTGRHLDAKSFNELTDRPETVVVDMRNHYESEIGHFRGAITPDVDTFRESLPVVVDMLGQSSDAPIVMYCTGGIRCEKASAWLKHNGFQNVYQLDGGIIEYARTVEAEQLENRFVGKNFVFDERLGERITSDVIAHCHQCGASCDAHTNCKNPMCNLLFIQCENCAAEHAGCCSAACAEIAALPEEEQRKLRKGQDPGVRIYSKGRWGAGPTR